MWRISSDIEDCCIERCLFVQLAGNLIFTEKTFNFVRPQLCPPRGKLGPQRVGWVSAEGA
jgi:hypothetical protein